MSYRLDQAPPATVSGSAVRAAREAAGLTQEEAAFRARSSVSSIRNAERGRTQPRPALLRRLAELYGVPMESLFEHEPEPATNGVGASRISAEVPAQRTPAAAQPSGQEIRATTGAHTGG